MWFCNSPEWVNRTQFGWVAFDRFSEWLLVHRHKYLSTAFENLKNIFFYIVSAVSFYTFTAKISLIFVNLVRSGIDTLRLGVPELHLTTITFRSVAKKKEKNNPSTGKGKKDYFLKKSTQKHNKHNTKWKIFLNEIQKKNVQKKYINNFRGSKFLLA